MITFSKYGEGDSETVSELIRSYWHRHYADGINYTSEQIDGFYSKGESPNIIASRMREGCIYERIMCDGMQVGLVGFQVMGDSLHVDKLYLDEGFRGRGIGRTAIMHMSEYAISKGCISIFLETNLINVNGMGFYKHMGFEVREQKPLFYEGARCGTMVIFEKNL